MKESTKEKLKKAISERRKARKDNEIMPNRIKRLKKVLKTKLT